MPKQHQKRFDPLIQLQKRPYAYPGVPGNHFFIVAAATEADPVLELLAIVQ